MPESIKVTHLVLSLDCGGLERIVLDLIRQGCSLGQQVAVLCLERPGTLAAQVAALGGSLLCLHKQPGLKLATINHLKRVLRELRPDVLHSHQIGALFYAGLAAHSAGVPVTVHTEHGNHFQHRNANPLVRLRKLLLWRFAAHQAAKLFCVTKDIAAELASRRIVPRHKLEVVANGIDTKQFAGRSEGEEIRQSLGISRGVPVIGTVGRLNEIKRQDLLIRAFASVRAEVANARLLLVGDGPMRNSLQELVTDLGLNDSVHFAGYQSHPEHYLQAMDVFALTSRSEGMPLAILEAWATGLPVIASAVGGVPDLVQHGHNGLLFPSGDQAMAAQQLRQLIHDRERARVLGAAGRQEVLAHYSLRRMAYDYQHHYLQLLGAKDRLSAFIPSAGSCPESSESTVASRF